MKATFPVGGRDLTASDLPPVGGVRAVRVAEPGQVAEFAVLVHDPTFATCPCPRARTGRGCGHIEAALRFASATGTVARAG